MPARTEVDRSNVRGTDASSARADRAHVWRACPGRVWVRRGRTDRVFMRARRVTCDDGGCRGRAPHAPGGRRRSGRGGGGSGGGGQKPGKAARPLTGRGVLRGGGGAPPGARGAGVLPSRGSGGGGLGS